MQQRPFVAQDKHVGTERQTVRHPASGEQGKKKGEN
jgi:hypothetical protein